MRRGNGTGSVYKLHGNRRKPWIAIKTNKVEGQEKPVKTIVDMPQPVLKPKRF